MQKPIAAGWQTTSSEQHFATPHLTVATEEVRTPAAAHARRWTVVHRKAAVVIAPVTAAGKFVLIQQERIPIRAAIWEMPAGQIDDAAPPDAQGVEAVAVRELREETGYELAPGSRLLSLGHYFSSPGFTDEEAWLFLARPVEKTARGPQHDAGEAILDCREFSPERVRQMIVENEIRDANTLAIWARLVASGAVPGLA